MSAVVRRATRLSGTFAVLTGGSNDDLQRKVACAAPRAPAKTFVNDFRTVLTGSLWWRCVLFEIRTYLAIITFLDLY